MSSYLIPERILQHYQNNSFECPYCRRLTPLKQEVLTDPESCGNCGKKIMMPYIIGDFCLFQKLGSGAMGSVYKAFHVQHHRSIYAIKLLHRHEKHDVRLIRVLRKEAYLASLLSAHSNIMNVISHGWDKGECFIVMEYTPGKTLLQMIEKRGKLSEIEAMEIIKEIVAAEKYILSQGYLFRDMKPENVWITKNGHILLLDFGLCLPREIAEIDQGKWMEASPIYVPPERLTGHGEDPTSEIYSLGMVFYYCVTGQPYFTTAKEIEGLLKRHVSEFRLSSEVTKMGKLPKDIADTIGKMIKRWNCDRYENFEALEKSLDTMISRRKTALQENK